jgi:hypothetical protein
MSPCVLYGGNSGAKSGRSRLVNGRKLDRHNTKCTKLLAGIFTVHNAVTEQLNRLDQ